MGCKPLAKADLEHVLAHTAALWPAMRGERVFVTGGTGFFGMWLLETFVHANRELGLRAGATVLTRDAAAFRAKAPHLAEDPAITLVEGDVRSFDFPAPRHGFVVHAATDSGSQAGRPAYELAESIVQGTRRTLEFARATGARRMLFTSSGAVYGRGITGMTHIPETYPGGPDPLRLVSSYDEGKRMAEHLCVAYTEGTALECAVARCFAFVGPHLPLDGHFAVGNFIRDAMAGTAIHIRGDGTPLRSYLYAGDLAIWLWTMLFRGAKNRAYNVGSGEAVRIGELARRTAAALAPSGGDRVGVCIDGVPAAGAPVATYVPGVERAEAELGLTVRVGLEDAIWRTAAWHGFQAGVPIPQL